MSYLPFSSVASRFCDATSSMSGSYAAFPEKHTGKKERNGGHRLGATARLGKDTAATSCENYCTWNAFRNEEHAQTQRHSCFARTPQDNRTCRASQTKRRETPVPGNSETLASHVNHSWLWNVQVKSACVITTCTAGLNQLCFVTRSVTC